jgi:hypothetical protein
VQIISTFRSKGGSISTIDFGVKGDFGTSGLWDVLDLYKNDEGVEGPIFMKTGRYSLQPPSSGHVIARG